MCTCYKMVSENSENYRRNCAIQTTVSIFTTSKFNPLAFRDIGTKLAYHPTVGWKWYGHPLRKSMNKVEFKHITVDSEKININAVQGHPRVWFVNLQNERSLSWGKAFSLSVHISNRKAVPKDSHKMRGDVSNHASYPCQKSNSPVMQ